MGAVKRMLMEFEERNWDDLVESFIEQHKDKFNPDEDVEAFIDANSELWFDWVLDCYNESCFGGY